MLRHKRRGWRGNLTLWISEVSDLFSTGLQLHWQDVTGHGGSPTRGGADGAGGRTTSSGHAPFDPKRRLNPIDGLLMIDTLLKDLRYAVRTLRKSPAFTAVVVLSLALGIGATSMIFSAINPILLRPLPFADPDRLVAIWGTSGRQPNATAATYREWKEHSPALEQLEYVVPRALRATFPGNDGAERLDHQYVSVGLFRLLGVEPMLGRNFVAEDEREGGVIISYGYWQRRFGGDPDILGRRLGSWNPAVVGVMPPGFQIFPWKEADFWAPLPNVMTGEGRIWGAPIGRLKPGVSMEQAQTQLDAIHQRLGQSWESVDSRWRAADSRWKVRVAPLHEFASRDYARNLHFLMGAVLLLLLIACSNVASLLVGRATKRHWEITTWAALGAGRLRLIRQMLTESVVLALLGGALGVLMAQVGMT